MNEKIVDDILKAKIGDKIAKEKLGVFQEVFKNNPMLIKISFEINDEGVSEEIALKHKDYDKLTDGME